MSLATLLYPPPTDRGMDEYGWANLDHHRIITSAIFKQREVRIQEYTIWPIRADNFDDFLRQHQSWHDAINAELNIPGTDLTNVDFQNQQQRDAWYWIHFIQHRAYAIALGEGL